MVLLPLYSLGAAQPGPEGRLTLGTDGNFYGMTSTGIERSHLPNGTVFKITPTGGLTKLYSFSATNGMFPSLGLTLGPDGDFYGTTTSGGTNGNSTIFEVTSTGVLTTLYTGGVHAAQQLAQSDRFYANWRDAFSYDRRRSSQRALLRACAGQCRPISGKRRDTCSGFCKRRSFVRNRAPKPFGASIAGGKLLL